MTAHRRAVAALAAAAALLTAAPAHAIPPTSITEVRHVHFTLASCGSFGLVIDVTVNRELTTFYDADGVPTRDVLARRQQGTFSNSVTGKSVPLSGNWRVVRYYADGVLNGTAIQIARTYTITVPGRGVIFLQAGYGVQIDGQTVFEVGPHDFEDRDFTEVCDYLAS